MPPGFADSNRSRPSLVAGVGVAPTPLAYETSDLSTLSYPRQTKLGRYYHLF